MRNKPTSRRQRQTVRRRWRAAWECERLAFHLLRIRERPYGNSNPERALFHIRRVSTGSLRRHLRRQLRSHVRVDHDHEADDEGQKDAVLERKSKQSAFI